LSRALKNQIERSGAGRLQTGAAVFAAEPAEEGLSRVGWFDVAEPSAPRCIAARWVVVATPYFFAGRILRGVDPDVIASMKGTARGSYLVANCCFEGRLRLSSYDAWTPSNAAFTNAVDASAVLPPKARPTTHGVLTVYAPFRDPAQGRALLLEGDRAALASTVVDGLRRFLPDAFASARLAEVRLTRWGHQHLIPRPGTVTRMHGLPNSSETCCSRIRTAKARPPWKAPSLRACASRQPSVQKGEPNAENRAVRHAAPLVLYALTEWPALGLPVAPSRLRPPSLKEFGEAPT
jgi:hypothetical protein